MTTNDLIKNNVSNAIKNSGRSLKEISNLAGIQYSAIIKYANKTRIPKLKNMIKLAVALNLKMDEILDVHIKTAILNEEKKKK